MGTHLEERNVVVHGQRLTFGLREGQPGRRLARDAVQDLVRSLGLPPRHGPGWVRTVTLDEVGVAVNREQELVHQVLAHSFTSSRKLTCTPRKRAAFSQGRRSSAARSAPALTSLLRSGTR